MLSLSITNERNSNLKSNSLHHNSKPKSYKRAEKAKKRSPQKNANQCRLSKPDNSPRLVTKITQDYFLVGNIYFSCISAKKDCNIRRNTSMRTEFLASIFCKFSRDPLPIKIHISKRLPGKPSNRR